MGFIEPDHEHGETDEDRESNIDPKKAVYQIRTNVARWYGCRPTMVSIVQQGGMRGFVRTIVDRTNEDGGKTEDDEWHENTLYRILD